jgi:choline-sulfatase
MSRDRRVAQEFGPRAINPKGFVHAPSHAEIVGLVQCRPSWHALKWTIWSMILLALVAWGFAPSVAAARGPNVLLICSDDHAAYVCGAYGNQLVRTPQIDRLASQGMRFDRAYCNSPVCTASRQSFLTGRYPRTIGVTQLQTPLPREEVTLAELLGQAGYRTISIGKMHFNSALKHGFETRIDQGEHRQHLKQQGGPQALDSDVQVLPQWKPFRDSAAIWLNASSLPFGAMNDDMTGTFFAREAAERLGQMGDEPFFLMVSFNEPHSPFRFPVEFQGRHDPARFPVPPIVEADRWQIPAIFRSLSDAEKQGIAASYYTSVEFMDKNVGLVLDALSAAGHDQDTLVIYIGDHGYMLGQHGRFEKHCCFEEAVRSPLIVRYPGHVQPGSTDALVEFVDLAPTVLQFCGIEQPRDVQGKSLVPLLIGRTRKHRDHVVVEYSENEEAMVETADWKLIYGTGQRERQDGYTTGEALPGRTIRLYDVEHDPRELANLADDPAQAERVDRMLDLLVAHLVRTARPGTPLPEDSSRFEMLDHCLQPRDISREEALGQ